MSRQLWKPVTESDGIPYDNLVAFTTALVEWRDEYLSMVGVPTNFEGTWDFVSVCFVSFTPLVSVDVWLDDPGSFLMRK